MYDVIVIGSDMSSLLAALSLQKRHKKVALLHDGRHTAFTDTPVHLFPVDPLPWTGLTEGGLLAGILKEHDISPPHDDQDGALQVIFPDRRIDLSPRKSSRSAKESTLSALHRATEKRGHALNELMAKALHPGTNNRGKYIPGRAMRHAGEWIETLFLAADASLLKERSPLSGVVPVLNRVLSSRSDDIPIHAPAFFHFLNEASHGFVSPGAKGKLTDSLKERFASLGGESFDIGPLSDLSIGREIAVEFEGEAVPSRIEAANLIVSLKWSGFSSFIKDDPRFSQLRRTLEPVSVREYPFAIHLGVDEGAFPEKMSNHVMLFDDSYRSYIGRNIYYLERSAAGDDESAPAGSRSLTVTTLLYNSPLSLNRTCLEWVFEDTVRNISRFLPFLGEHTYFRDAGFSIDISRSCQEVVNRKYYVRKGLFSDIHSLSSHTTPIGNVFITGGMLLPGLGFDGEVLSGLHVARCLDEE